ncbi:hypothetical protein A3Q56_07467 [Intoshia linei]|uniref:N-acetylgalactosaminide beta-1,3-galactosyltransferase n=1 Tax=Intoshia linei TaxID=1819745 RepID=A0A177ATW7_9BILA|nr:hypothetical protein A3Q56_07467 [Intoshia linei]
MYQSNFKLNQTSYLDLNTSEIKNIKIFCFIITYPKNLKVAKLLNILWTKKCDGHVFISSEKSKKLPIHAINITESHNILWPKTVAGFKYAYDNIRGNYDWVFKADDDTFAIIENMKLILSKFNSSEKLYAGRRFKWGKTQGYMSGGAGYLLSKAAVDTFVEKAMINPNICDQTPEGAEDVKMGICAENSGIKAIDTRDSKQRQTFFALEPISQLIANNLSPKFWLRSYDYYPFIDGNECCSNRPATFHYVNYKMLHLYYYLIYNVHVNTTYTNKIFIYF